jgi:hypothetical protein
MSEFNNKYFKFITKNFNGPFTDFTPDWYSEVGSIIVRTMIINAFIPYAMLIYLGLYKWYRRWSDHKGDIY